MYIIIMKQVYAQLHKLNICMSYVATNRPVTALGEGHDQVVMEWRDYFDSQIRNAQVSCVL